jgi:hypothetical protein
MIVSSFATWKLSTVRLLKITWAVFDEGHLSQDLVAAQAEIAGTLAIMEDISPPVRVEDNPIRYVFQISWDRFKKVAAITQKIFYVTKANSKN